ncbi:MAG: inorganic phosphate transporter [Solirubrobacterales bacterium]
MSSDAVLVIAVAAALAFGFSNGFQDTFDVISTLVSTGAAPPHLAIAGSALLNFAGAFISVAVAATIAREVVEAAAITPAVVLAGVLAAITWNVGTWRLGLPSSSSHALIGGVVGATIAAAGTGAVFGDEILSKVLIPALLAPLAALALATVAIVLAYRLFGHRRPGPVTRGFRLAQLVSGGLLALGHGANDAQKTMGVIALALIANGTLNGNADPPLWTTIAAATAIALGTYVGGWRVLRAAGRRVIKMDAAQAFSAQSSGAAVILASTHLGFPLSTTHVTNAAVMGAGAGKRVSAVRWGVAGNLVAAWLLTLPAAAAMGAAAYGFSRAFGTGVLGPAVLALVAVLVAAFVLGRRLRAGTE